MRNLNWLLFLLTLLPCCYSTVGAVDTSSIPDFKAIFLHLDTHRQLYNATNDSLFLPTTEDEWLALSLRRADTNHQMYDINQEMIDYVMNYFLEPSESQEDATSGHLKLRPNIPDQAFNELRSAMFRYKGCLDPFIGELMVGNILLPHLETQDVHDPEVAAHMVHDYYCYGDCLYSIFCMGDSTALPKAYQMFRQSIWAGKYCPTDRPEYALSVFSACHLLSRPRLNDIGKLRNAEADSTYSMLMSLLQKPGLKDQLMQSEPFSYNRSFFYLAQHYPIYRLRALILLEDQGLLSPSEKSELSWRQELMRLVIGKNPITMYTDSLNVIHSTRFLVRAHAGLMSYDDALDSCAVYYQDWKPLSRDKQANFTDVFRHFVYIAKDMMYLCRHSSHDANYGKWLAKQICNQATKILLTRPHGELESQDTNLLMILLHDPNLLQNLGLEERIGLMREMIGVTQIQTLAHNDCVVWLAYHIFNAVIEHHPESLVGILGTQSVEDVKAQSDNICRFMVQGAFIHDIGKMRMNSVICNEYRHLTDHEFELIKLHSEYSTGVLQLLPEYHQYLDFALGHHRWYDGSAGYPMWYDNTKSPIRILVDILTVADCLEAATNRLSRNFRRFKSFDETIDEFRRDAGTRYNPLVVESITFSPETIEALQDRVVNGWRTSYKTIFERMINR